MSQSRKSPTTTLLERLERDPALGRAADAMSEPVDAVLGAGPLGDALRGRSIGHALHPVLVQVPIGAVTCAAVLDLMQGRKAAAQSRLLMGLACLTLAPAAFSGWAEWAHADDKTKRVGIVHAALNATAGVASFASYVARRSGWSPAAAVLTGVAGTALGCGGLLGGHLSLVRKYASHDEPSDTEGSVHGAYSD